MADILRERVTKKFTHAFHISNAKFMNINSFRRVAEIAIVTASKQVLDEAYATANSIFHDPEYDDLFVDKQGALKAVGGIDQLAVDQAKFQLQLFRDSVDAASLVFAHSILDGVAFEYCEIVAMLDSTLFEGWIDDRQIRLKDMKGKTYEDILSEKVGRFLKELEKDSLLKKTNLLFTLGQPPKDFAPVRGFKFDRERLEKLDIKRHEIVHEKIDTAPLQKGEDDIRFIRDTANFLMALVSKRFGVKIDPYLLVKDWPK
ncbi:MAG: hypothetical protein HYW28_08530 [Rhodospirillales bacterium]|nr:hypothetical protein [Rhodospirillales bacterium]